MFDVRRQVHTLLDEATAPDVNVGRIERRHRWGKRWRRWALVGLAALGALVALVALAQLVARPDRIEPVAEPTAEPASSANRASAAQAPVAEPTTDTTTDASATAGQIGNEPRPDLIPLPELITTDGAGGFVGVRSASAQNPQVVFTRSSEGETWELASRWSLGPNTTIDRFERSGEYYMAWISSVATTSDTVIGTVGITRDLIAWTVVELALDDEAPRGLIFEPTITDLSVSGNNILALVTTNVAIDFAALSLSESYTCGQTITDDEVTVNLCNAELDVLSLSGVNRLPERNRLFVSRDGMPFGETEVPFDSLTAAHLTTVNGAFVMTDETGVRFATSTDATTWTTITAGKPPFPVRAAATNVSNEVVGVGTAPNGDVILFHTAAGAAESTTKSLELLTGPVDGDIEAVVASGLGRWVVYLYQPGERAWMVTSQDGQSWTSHGPTPVADAEPILLVGDDEALLQWMGVDGITTIGVPLR